MAKSSGFDSESVREDEREVETRAAYASKGAVGDDSTGEFKMPSTTTDGSEAMAQRIANAAAGYNEGGSEDGGNSEHGTGTEVY